MKRYENDTLSIASWNVNGLSSKVINKLEDPDLHREINQHHVVCLSETHLGPEAPFNLDGYHVVQNNRKVCPTNNRYYGGLALCIRQEIRVGVAIMDNSDTESIWVKLKKDFFKLEQDIYIGFIYIVPCNTSLTQTDTDNPFGVTIQKFHKYQEQGKVLIMGDMNARTSKQT